MSVKVRIRKCVCTQCSDGYCGVETTSRDYRGYPFCTACMKGEHRIRAVSA